MTFPTESEGYKKTALSDLQGAWSNFRSLLAEADGMNDRNRLLFHVDEAMSWECVRNLEHMSTLTIVRFRAPEQIVPNPET